MGARDPLRFLCVHDFERMPILDRTLTFATMNQSTVCIMETEDVSGARRGAIALGIAHSSSEFGTAIYSSIDEAEALIVLLRNAIDDARRIENGEAPLAAEGIEPPVKH